MLIIIIFYFSFGQFGVSLIPPANLSEHDFDLMSVKKDFAGWLFVNTSWKFKLQ